MKYINLLLIDIIKMILLPVSFCSAVVEFVVEPIVVPFMSTEDIR